MQEERSAAGRLLRRLLQKFTPENLPELPQTTWRGSDIDGTDEIPSAWEALAVAGMADTGNSGEFLAGHAPENRNFPAAHMTLTHAQGYSFLLRHIARYATSPTGS